MVMGGVFMSVPRVEVGWENGDSWDIYVCTYSGGINGWGEW